ncbi:MAG: hypothetical protein RBT69_07065 [Spirochaetia bacterium]|jgi:hypothetical protein|nr:hypothetical protein [Spirochaetia bacterium]
MADIEKWKKIIISLHEQIFFDLMRNYLGDVKTPFNKHTLIDELIVFFSKEKNVEKIVSLIDKNDASVLAALSILGPVRIKNLYQFFSDKKNYYDFCLHLQNLEERMLICTDESSSEYPHLVISPILSDILEEKIINPEIIIPSSGASQPEIPENALWFNDPLLFSVFSFLLRQGQILKLDGNFRKKVTEELKIIFPDQLAVNPEIRVDIIRMIFRRLGLVKQVGDYFHPVPERWKELADLSPEERMKLCVGAAFSKDYRFYVSLIEELFKTLRSTGKGFNKKSLIKIIELLFIKNSHQLPEKIEHIITIMCGLGFLHIEDDIYFPNPAVTAFLPDTISEASGGNNFIIQPNFDIHVSKNISFKDGLLLAISAEIKRYSEMVYFSLTRESFLRALESGYDSASVAALFNRLGGFSVPQNIMFSMENWEKEYKSLTFYNGVVLVADEKKRNIIDNSGHFSSNLCKKLADGVYLVNQKNIPALFESFKKAGIDNLPTPDSLVPGYVEFDEKKVLEPEALMDDVQALQNMKALDLDYTKQYHPVPEFVDPDSEEIRKKIENSKFNAEQKEVISERVERKLILFPEQISKGIARYERTEAKGLDYNGKVRIAEQIAGSTGFLAEIIETTPEGEFVKRLIKPEKLEKDGTTYILKGVLLQDDSEVSINISKISLIRKIRTSLFVK